jgi:D-sedoheptulose 7-phosphate isomerase
MSTEITRQFDLAVNAIRDTGAQMAEPLARAVELTVATLRAGGCVFVFGNGGSAADAQHIAAELVGRFKRNRNGFASEALTTDTSAITAIANDFGFDTIFARQLEGKGRTGDLAIGISTSGNSPNVVAGLEQAKVMGMKTIAMTGKAGGACASLADVLLAASSDDTPHIQEAHQVMYHILCDLTEAELAE